MLTQSPERNWDFMYASHPDHLATAEAAVCAVYPDARNPFAFPELLEVEGLEPWTVPELWIMGPGAHGAGIAVETTDTIERKLAALMCHKSQIEDPEGVAARVRSMAQAQAQLAGLPARVCGRAVPGHAHPLTPMGPARSWVVIQHVAHEGPGAIATALVDTGQPHRIVRHRQRGDHATSLGRGGCVGAGGAWEDP